MSRKLEGNQVRWTAGSNNYVTRVWSSPLDIDRQAWNALLQASSNPTPFMRHEYLCALHRGACATARTGWTPRFITLHDSLGRMVAACPLYQKLHSRGEYVFDWAWAEAYERHGLAYYPKGLAAVPFTPVPGSRLLAVDAPARSALLDAVIQDGEQAGLSSFHLLFGSAEDIKACAQAGLLLRQTVQFHWENLPGRPYRDFEEFLAALTQEKRKKIRQERRKVRDAGVSMRVSVGSDISVADWNFFYACYERTYFEHGNPPYLSRAFFSELAREQAGNWALFVAEREGHAIAASLIAIDPDAGTRTAWGRYWGALERVDCLHFEACYYAPLEWCIREGYARFEGGAQGEHKLARALLPVKTWSAHRLSHPEFARAVENYLLRETASLDAYVDELERHSPLKDTDA